MPDTPPNFLIDDDGFFEFTFKTADGRNHVVVFDAYETARDIENRISDDMRNANGEVYLDDFGGVIKSYLAEKHGLTLSVRGSIQFGEILYEERNRLAGFTNGTPESPTTLE